MSNQVQYYIKPGALCNCNGEGDRLLVMRQVEESRVSVLRISSVDIPLEEAQRTWQSLFWWESKEKIHQEFLTDEEKNFNLVERFGAEMDERTEKIPEIHDVPIPDDVDALLLAHWGIDEDTYIRNNRTCYMAAYLANKILEADEDLSLAMGKIVLYLMTSGFSNILAGYKPDSVSRITAFICSLGLHKVVAQQYADTYHKWSNEAYRQHVKKAVGGG